MTADDYLVVALGAAVAAIYFPVMYYMARSWRGAASLATFARALFQIGQELSDGDDWVAEAIERLEAIFQQSGLSRNFASLREVVEQLHYLAYAPRMMFLGFALAYRRRDENRNALLTIRAELAVQDQPYSALRGDARMLVEAVNANLDPTADGGRTSLKQLADYMKGVDRQLSRQRRLNIVYGVVSIVGTVVAIVALTVQFMGSVPS